MQDIQLSIIVPVYNVEPFLRKCVESLEQQDLAAERYEVILVNDSSSRYFYRGQLGHRSIYLLNRIKDPLLKIYFKMRS